MLFFAPLTCALDYRRLEIRARLSSIPLRLATYTRTCIRSCLALRTISSVNDMTIGCQVTQQVSLVACVRASARWLTLRSRSVETHGHRCGSSSSSIRSDKITQTPTNKGICVVAVSEPYRYCCVARFVLNPTDLCHCSSKLDISLLHY